MNAKEIYSQWTNANNLPDYLKDQLNDLGKDEKWIEDAFGQDINFGTAGMRGRLEPGTNRINLFTVGRVTEGLARLIDENGEEAKKRGVAISFDSRYHSREFAEHAARILGAHGIHVYLFDDLRPTPELSFAVRHLNTFAGINITASHNAKQYNGYKVYGEDGAQMAPENADRLFAYAQKVDDIFSVKAAPVEELRANGTLQLIGEDVDEAYLARLKDVTVDPEMVKANADKLKIIYTPLHGTGMTMIPRSLKLWGFENIHCVEEQMVKSGDFPTVVSPNPENGEALTLALRDAKAMDADVVMASDPDADRVGMACKNDKGEWILINGNQTCLLFLYYIITNRKATGKMRDGDFIVKTIVTTEVIREIAEKQNIEMRDCYTGFKWIAREIAISEGKQQYIGGGEESYGFLAQDFVRDKDAVSACSLLAEICAYAKDKGKTLYDILMDIYAEYGFSKEFTINVVKPGKSGADEIKQMMTDFRNEPPKEIGGSKVIVCKDYQTLEQTNANGTKTKLDMPTTSNVLQWFCEDGTKISVRPSGTEPKIKFYIEIKDNSMKCSGCYDRCCSAAENKINAIKSSLKL